LCPDHLRLAYSYADAIKDILPPELIGARRFVSITVIKHKIYQQLRQLCTGYRLSLCRKFEQAMATVIVKDI